MRNKKTLTLTKVIYSFFLLFFLCPIRSYAQDGRGYYIRLEGGSSNAIRKSVEGQSFPSGDPWEGDLAMENSTYGASPVFGVGVGYQVNTYIGFDVTWDYYLARRLASEVYNMYGASEEILLNKERSWTLLFNTSITPYTFNVSHDITLSPLVVLGVGYANNHVGAEDEEAIPILGPTPRVIFRRRDEPVGHGFAWQAGLGVQTEWAHHFVLGATYRLLSLGRLSKDRKLFKEKIHVRDIVAGEALVSVKYIF